VPGPLGERVSEAVTEVEPGWIASLAVPPPSAHRTGGQVRVDGHDVDLCVTKEPVNYILPNRPQPSLDDYAELDVDGRRHQPGQGVFKMSRKPG
jgi:hypothetical protein